MGYKPGSIPKAGDPVTCSQCGQSFDRPYKLALHMEQDHGK